jgi:hypothetical protein
MDGSVKVEAQTSGPEAPAETPARRGKGKTRRAPPRIGKPAKAARAPRGTSSIGFPYVDLEVAISVARAFLDAGGIALTREQLAGAMKTTVNNGGFINKLAAARLFGLLESREGKHQLTQVGFSIVDPDREKAARAEAFLTVPLFRRIYDEFRGKQLPPRPHGLEQALVQFGVVPKQKDKARRAFDSSARQAGFFVHGEDRLIEPVIGVPLPLTAESRLTDVHSQIVRSHTHDVRGGRKGYHPFIEGLLEELPAPRTVWPDSERAKWLRAAEDIFELIYESGPEAAPPIESAAQDLKENKPSGPESVHSGTRSLDDATAIVTGKHR